MLAALFLVVATSTASLADDLPCVHYFTPVVRRFAEARSPIALPWTGMRDLCKQEHPGYGVLTKYEYLERAVLDLCADQKLVPFGVEVREDGVVMWSKDYGIEKQPLLEEDKIKTKLNADTGTWGSLHWPSNGVDTIGPETTFFCAVCELYDRATLVADGIYPPHDNSQYAYDLELVSHDRVDDIGLVANGSDVTNRLLADLAEAFNVSITALSWHGAESNADRKAVVHVYYEREGDNMDWVHYVHWDDEYYDRKTVDDFEIAMVKLNTECLSDKELKNVDEEKPVVGTLDYSANLDDSTVTLRECYWNTTTNSAKWSPTETWYIRWHPCTIDDLKVKPTETYSGMLRALDLGAAFRLKYLVDNAFIAFDIRTLLGGIDLSIKAHSSPKSNTTLAFVTSENMMNIAAMFARNVTEETAKKGLAFRYPYVQVTEDSHNVSNPLKGASISIDNSKRVGSTKLKEIKAQEDESNLENGTLAVVTVSESIVEAAEQLVFTFYATHQDDVENAIQDPAFGAWLTLVQVTFRRSGNADAEDFVDIAFVPDFRESGTAGKCAEWSFASSMWSGRNCRLQRWRRNSMPVCRCKHLHTLPNTSVTTGVYIVYGYDASMRSYHADNKEMILVTSTTLFFSAFGIMSIWVTAIAFKEWGSKLTSKILLHMTFALGVNICLVTMTNFWEVDEASVICVIVGVVRHYSFQAMFYWMLVLSIWQMKVLTSRKDHSTPSTSQSWLLAKLSLFAWGCPLIPIIILLAWDVEFYNSILSYRGYCYPEGMAFELTVQAPAGVVLVLNFVLFAYVVARNYCCCREDVAYRRENEGKRTAQVRRLAKVVVLFFVFGFTWLFHFLSEEGVINNEFLFEFCFIITVAVHLCLLSVFFVFFNREVRRFWVGVWNSKMAAMGCDTGVLADKIRYGSFSRNSVSSVSGISSVRMSDLRDDAYD